MANGERAALGRSGEDAALSAYAAAGYRLVARNWRCPLGELDLVVASGTVLVICEVKTRGGSGFGSPFEAVTATKRRRLRALAAAFLSAMTPGHPSAGLDVRFDVASVSIDGRGHTDVYLFEDAF